MATTNKFKKTIDDIKATARFLSDVQPDKSFWVSNGWIVRNMKELPLALRKMNNDTFVYHVNKGKNDFYNWVNDVVGDKKLALDIKSAYNKSDMIAAIERRIEQLKRA
jgi:alpha-amylase